MSNLDEDTLNDIELARKIISESDSSFVVVQYNKIWKEKKEAGIKPIIEAIRENKGDLKDTIIGINFLDKASAMLCRYARVNGVYAPRATKTGIAVLIMAGIPSEIDEMIQKIDNADDKNSFYNDLIKDVESPEEAFKILEKKTF